jgi:hypothetical protein
MGWQAARLDSGGSLFYKAFYRLACLPLVFAKHANILVTGREEVTIGLR